MRIEAYNQVLQSYKAQKQSKVQKATASASFDKLQISSAGRDFQVAKAAVNASPDVREELTASFKEQIKNGTYEVKAESFADKLLGAFQRG
jgi:negative regulator of flagellin synthesis FlgM